VSERSLEQKTHELACGYEREWIHRGRIISVCADVLKNAARKKWDIVLHPGAVVVIPVAPDGSLLFIKQWRRAVGAILIEFPAGTLDPEESSERCAARELQEETGFKATALTRIGGFYSTPGFCTEYLHLFVGQGLEPSPLPHDDDEAIDLLPLPLEEALEWASRGTICDAKTVASLLLYQRWMLQWRSE
jgi:ADP-ribose pyrophosphatase